MGKAPSFQFYPSDWMRDLSEHPLEIEGAWIRICCALFYSETKGFATKTLTQWARVMRVGEKKSLKIIAYLDNQKIAEVVNQNGGIGITSRRMVRDEELKKIRYLAGIQGGNPAIMSDERKAALVNQDLLKLNRRSSSASSSSSTEPTPSVPKKPVTYPEWFEAWWTLYPARNGKKAGKRSAWDLCRHLPEADVALLMTATTNYAALPETQGYAKDPERFLKKDYWRDFIEMQASTGPVPSYSQTGLSSKNREGFA